MTEQQNKEQAIVELSGNLTLSHANEIRDKLINAIDGSASIAVRFGGVQDVDLSCLQLMCSAHRSALKKHKQIAVEGPVPMALKEAATAAGFMRLKGCTLDPDNSCIWMLMAGA
jgi:anti-anti-sigma regulatory factor